MRKSGLAFGTGAQLVAILVIGTAGGWLFGCLGEPCRAAESGRYADEVRDILKSGFGPGQADLQAAEGHYNAAIRVSAADPRAHQAWGLVLLKQSKNKEALEEFRVAVQQPGALHAEGWESLVRVQAAGAQYPDVLRSLVGYANAVNASNPLLDDQTTKEDCAEWIGRMMAFVQTDAARSPDITKSIVTTDREIRNVLARKDYDDCYDSGKANLFADTARASRNRAALEKLRDDRRQIETKRGRAISIEKNSIDAFKREAASVQKEFEDSAAAKAALQLAQSELESTLKRLGQDMAQLEKNYPFGPPSPFPSGNQIQFVQNSFCVQFYLQSLADPTGEQARAFLQDLQRAPLEGYWRAYRASVIYLKSRKTKIEIEIRRTGIKALHLLLKQRRLAARQEWSSVQSQQQIKSLADWEAQTNLKAAHLHDQDRDRQADKGPSPLLSVCFPLDFDFEQGRVLLSLCEAAPPTSARQTATRYIALPKPSFRKAGDETSYIAEVRKFLRAGLEAGNDPLADARPSFKQAQRPSTKPGPDAGNDAFAAARLFFQEAQNLYKAKDDPRLFYGWGLVCLKSCQNCRLDVARRQLVVARAQFERAAQLADGQYLPAWEAWARTQLLQQNAPAVMNTLLKMAPLLADEDNRMLTQAQKEAGARWVGRAMFCVETNWKDLPTWPSVKRQIEQNDSKFEGLFHDKLWMAYENGRHRANKKAQAVEQRDESTRTPRAYDSSGKRTQKGDQLQEKQEKIRKATANLEKQLDDGFNKFQNWYIELESGNARLQVWDKQLDWELRHLALVAAVQFPGRNGPVWRVPQSAQAERESTRKQIHKYMQVTERGRALLDTGYESFLEAIGSSVSRCKPSILQIARVPLESRPAQPNR